jgi:hypothetical protein
LTSSDWPCPDDGATAWAPYALQADNYQRMRLPAPTADDTVAERHHCDFWDVTFPG